MLSNSLRLPVAVARRSSVPMARMASSSAAQLGGIPTALYKNVWRKSNIMYITYIVAGCVVIEVVYGSVTNGIWESRNKGVSLISFRFRNLFICFAASFFESP